MRKYRIAIIGAGSWAEKYCNTLSSSEEEIELVAISRPKDERPSFISETTKLYSDYHTLIQEERPDGIIIATDNPGVVLLEILEYNIPILCEKPALLSTTEIFEFASWAVNRKLSINYIHLFSRVYKTFKRQLADKKITRIYTTGYNSGPARKHFSSLWDYGPHDLSMILDLLNQSPDDIYITRQSKIKNKELFNISMKFGKIRTGSLVGNGALEKSRSLHIFYEEDGKTKEAIYDDLNPDKLLIDGQKIEYDNTVSPLEDAINNLLWMIDGKMDSINSVDLTVKITKILDSYKEP